MRLSSFTVIFFIAGNLLGQLPELGKKPYSIYEDAMKAYNMGGYSVAARLFGEYLKTAEPPRSEAYFLKAVALLRNGGDQGKRGLIAAMDRFPAHPMKQRALYELGVHSFNKKNYNKALQYLSGIDLGQFVDEEREFICFGLGYADMKVNTPGKAVAYFEKARDFGGAYFSEATYYLATLYISQGRSFDALPILREIDSGQGAFKNEVPVLIAGIYYNNDQKKELYGYAPGKITGDANAKNKQLNLVLGGAYFEDGSYEEAADYFENYLALTGKRARPPVFFKLGLSYFHLGQNKGAIDNFKKAGLEKGKMGQVSSYYLGRLYLKESNPDYAYSAFKTVSGSGEDAEMSEEAAFALGKINFQRGQFAGAIKDFERFIATYPKSPRKHEANELMAQSYLRTSDYDRAIAHLEAVPRKSRPLREAYQQVTFQKAQLLYNDGRYAQAVLYLKKASNFPGNADIAAETWLLMGESYSMLHKVDLAEDVYLRCIKTARLPFSLNAKYGLGYLHYNKKDFAVALSVFDDFVGGISVDHEFYYDALTRLADCRYVSKDYDRAIEGYQRVSDPLYLPYVTYQKGLIYKLQGQYDRAMAAFRAVSLDRTSGYADNALYQEAGLLIDRSKFEEALAPLGALADGYPGSNLLPYTMGQQALCYFNTGQFEEASLVYLDILENHIAHEVAHSALLGLQEVMKKGVGVPEFDNLTDAYKNANPDDTSVEVIEFEDAKTNYYDQKYSQAREKFIKFIEKYPGSGFKEDAKYFLADAYFKENEWKNAVAVFGQLIDRKSPVYIGRALDKRGRALINLGLFDRAIANYQQLYDVAQNRKEMFKANEGLMKAFYMAGKTDSAFYYANLIIDSEWKPANAESSILLFKANIFIEREEYTSAVDELLKIINGTPGEKGAEASLMMAGIYYKTRQFKRSLEVLFDMNKTYAAYPFWIGRSFLLIADNYIAMDELLQARATTESIIQNASVRSIKAEALEKLEIINAKEQELLLKTDTTETDLTK